MTTNDQRPDRTFKCEGEHIRYHSIADLLAARGHALDDVPYATRVLLENVLRAHAIDGDDQALEGSLDALLGSSGSISLRIGRVILPDSSGLPVLMDLAALRDAVARAGGDPSALEPEIPLDLIIDHSLQVHMAGSHAAIDFNLARDFRDNEERYRFLKWAQGAFRSLRVFPPGTGIIHQINLEYLAPVVVRQDQDGGPVAFPDLVLGCDSHTPMVNALGVIGWGIGGIDAELIALGQPYVFAAPDMVGVKFVNELPVGVLTTDLALTVTERLRKEGVVGDIVEFFGPPVAAMSIPDRATVANMAVEYGATCGYFPVDSVTLGYLRMTGRPRRQVALVEAYGRANNLFRDADAKTPRYDRTVEIDLAGVRPSVAGPRRPQDRMALPHVRPDFEQRLTSPKSEGGFGVAEGARSDERPAATPVEAAIRHGSVVIASITSCTNTSNPEVMIAAGLVAKKAAAAGLAVPPWVKTSLAPGSRVVTRYLEQTDLLRPLEQLGFHIIGYGCTTCGGKSGPLNDGVSEAVQARRLVGVAVLSGNRNFEGRIHTDVQASYLASPPLVVLYALAGRIDIDPEREAIGRDHSGRPVFMRDLWPTSGEISELMGAANRTQNFVETYADAEEGTAAWRSLQAPRGARFSWNPQSHYIVEPPFIANTEAPEPLPETLDGAVALAAFGDSFTTDHIAPSGSIPVQSPAGQYLIAHGVSADDFNTYSTRRCNHEVAARATFSNSQVRNLLLPGSRGGVARHIPSGRTMAIYDVAAAYRESRTPLIILAGKEYGTGSSRDWAAKGPALLGVRAIIAESFERIHRANLVGMGVVPLLFARGCSWQALGLNGDETFEFANFRQSILDEKSIVVKARRDAKVITFEVSPQVLTNPERETLQMGNVFQLALSRLGAVPIANLNG